MGVAWVGHETVGGSVSARLGRVNATMADQKASATVTDQNGFLSEEVAGPGGQARRSLRAQLAAALVAAAVRTAGQGPIFFASGWLAPKPPR